MHKTILEVKDNGASSSRTVELTASEIINYPVLQNSVITTPSNRKLGYLVFTDHIATAEAPLISTFQQFKQAQIDDLVIDLRYNGGGYLYIANEVASMIGGTRYKAEFSNNFNSTTNILKKQLTVKTNFRTQHVVDRAYLNSI